MTINLFLTKHNSHTARYTSHDLTGIQSMNDNHSYDLVRPKMNIRPVLMTFLFLVNRLQLHRLKVIILISFRVKIDL